MEGICDLDPTINLELLEYLTGDSEEGSNSVQYLARFYEVERGNLYRIMGDERKMVPTIGERELLVKHIHYLSAHAGLRRTRALIWKYFFWPKMHS